MSLEFWTLAVALVTSITCALCGSLLLVSRRAMVSEGLSHAVLPGLVLAFLVTRDYASPWLIASAAASGLLMIWLTQLLRKTGLVDDDAGLGIVFSAMFSIGVLIVSMELKNTHFHAACIIDGNLALAALDQLEVNGRDWGPRTLYVMGGLLAALLTVVILAYKEIKLSVFDAQLAKRLRLKPGLVEFVILSLISLTTVAAFEVAGSILVVALMVAPPAAAYLLTNRLSRLLVLATVTASISCFLGFYCALRMDTSPTGPIASAAGFVFLVTLAIAPKQGLVARIIEFRRRRNEMLELLVLQLISDVGHSAQVGLTITPQSSQRRIARLLDAGLLERAGDDLRLTPAGIDALSRL